MYGAGRSSVGPLMNVKIFRVLDRMKDSDELDIISGRLGEDPEIV